MVDKFKYRGSAFCHCFVNHFCIVLDRYTKIISNGKKDKDPSNDLVNGLGWVIGGAVGAAAGPLVSAAGVAIAAGTSVRVGGSIGTMGAGYLHNKFSYSKQAKCVVRFVDNGTSQELEYFDPAEQRRLLVHVLVEAAAHIFKMFEYQFMKISNNGIVNSIDRLAYDAACRAVSYIVEHSSEDPTFSASVFIKGVLQGISKKSKFAKVTASVLGQEGLNITTDAGAKWNTAKLFSEVGVKASNCVYVKHEFAFAILLVGGFYLICRSMSVGRPFCFTLQKLKTFWLRMQRFESTRDSSINQLLYDKGCGMEWN